MKIRRLATIDFPPFANGGLDFPPVPDRPKDLAEVHLLTGVNGAGKSRVLCALAAVLGENRPLQERCAGSGTAEFGVMVETTPMQAGPVVQMTVGKDGVNVKGNAGTIVRDQLGKIPAYASAGGAYLREDAEEGGRGGRSSSVYAAVSGDAQFAPLLFHKPARHTADFMQALTNLYVKTLADKQEGKKQSRAGRLLTAILDALRATTDSEISLSLADSSTPALELRWRGVPLALNQLPDGLRALLGWMVDAALMLEMVCGRERDPFSEPSIILLDEVEAHLHPKWQRKLLPAFQRMFPAAQIFVATHSPFVISSLNCGWIHVLKAGKDGKIETQPPQAASPGDSYPSVLAEIMDVEEWYDVETEKLLAQFREVRDKALAGDAKSAVKARELGQTIGQRSHELGAIMGAELARLAASSTGLRLPGMKPLTHGLARTAGHGLSKRAAAKK